MNMCFPVNIYKTTDKISIRTQSVLVKFSMVFSEPLYGPQVRVYIIQKVRVFPVQQFTHASEAYRAIRGRFREKYVFAEKIKIGQKYLFPDFPKIGFFHLGPCGCPSQFEKVLVF